jgi:cytochrome c biogenesis protein CcmG/thiol:disulfide interchange protein DsbE
MRKAAIGLGVLAVVAAIVVGIGQARDHSGAAGGVPRTLTRAEVAKPIPGAPPVLAALRRRVNVLAGGGVRAFDAQLRALRGHPVVVNLWASSCGPCRYELPVFQHEALARGAQVAFLGVDVTDDRDEALKLATRFPMPYPSFSDPRGNISVGRFRSQALPTTAFYDARGKLAIVHQGPFTDQAKLSAAIERYALGRTS